MSKKGFKKLGSLLNRHISFALWVHLLFFLILVVAVLACAPLSNKTSGAVVAGGVAGSLINETATKVESSLKPEYAIYAYPMELCSWGEEDMMECRIVPCLFLDKTLCVKEMSFEEFKAQNPKVPTLTLTLKQFSAIINKCKKNPDLCIEYIGKYSGERVVVHVKKH